MIKQTVPPATLPPQTLPPLSKKRYCPKVYNRRDFQDIYYVILGITGSCLLISFIFLHDTRKGVVMVFYFILPCVILILVLVFWSWSGSGSGCLGLVLARVTLVHSPKQMIVCMCVRRKNVCTFPINLLPLMRTCLRRDRLSRSCNAPLISPTLGSRIENCLSLLANELLRFEAKMLTINLSITCD
jgi:hypothetical protein